MQASSTLQSYLNEQAALDEQYQALVAQKAAPEQLEAWALGNAAQLAAQRQQAAALTLASGMAIRSTNQKINIPANASATLKAFLATQEALSAGRARIHNQLVQQAAANGTPTLAKLKKLEAQEELLFRQQNAAALQLQVTRAEALAGSAAQQAVTVPALQIPSNATPTQAAFMLTRNQLRRSLAQLHNQYANATPAERTAALTAWRQQNAALLAQLKQQAKSLSPSATN